MNSRRLLVLGAAAITAIVMAGGYLGYTKFVDQGRCLKDGERAVYEVVKKGSPATVQVSVFDDEGSTMTWRREIEIPDSDVFVPLKLGRCAFYVEQAINYDYDKQWFPAGYERRLNRYDFFSNASAHQIVLEEENKTGKSNDFQVFFARLAFAVSPSEHYISLVHSYLEKPDYALVIRNLQTGKDEYVLTLADLLKQHPTAAGSFDVGEWYTRPDGTEVLLGNLYQDRYKPAFYLLEAGTWKMHVWPTPQDFSGYSEFAIAKYSPHFAYTDFDVFGGIDTLEDQIFADKVARGDMVHLKVANLETGKTDVIAEVPLVRHYRFNLTWLSETQLQYTMPDGTTRTYTVQ